MSRIGLLGILVLLASAWPPGAWGAAADLALPAGHFYTQAGGHDGAGFTIDDGAAGKFWTSFQALGGVAALGYPASTPFRREGFTYQATQGALLQWHPDVGRALLANTFDLLSDAGLDEELYRDHQIPFPIHDDGSGGDYARAVATRLGWLTDPGIAQRFYANPNPSAFPTWTVNDSIQLYGLPMSRPETFGPFVSQRFQRITLQRWLQLIPGMPAPGSVVRVLGGDLAKETGIVPTAAQQPRPVPTEGDTTPDLGPGSGAPLPPAPSVLPPGPSGSGRVINPVAPINLFPLAPCRASALDPNSNQNVTGTPAPEAGDFKVYGGTMVKLEHNDNCWSPSQLAQMGNHRDIGDITEVVIHWTGLDYAHSAYYLRRGVSVHYLIPKAADPAQPPLEMIDPRNAAWHAGPLNKGMWEDADHRICQAGRCEPNGNVHSIGFENEGSDVPNDYQVNAMTDIIAGLILEGYPIKLDRQHIVGHRDINSHKSDPGDLDLDHVIALVRQKLQAQPPSAPNLEPLPVATPLPSVDGSSARPFPFTGNVSAQVTGSPGGVNVFYVIERPSSGQITFTFSYQGMAAPPGSVGVNVYQQTSKLGTASPPGNQAGGASVTVNVRQDTAVVLQVFSYVPQTVTYQLSGQ